MRIFEINTRVHAPGFDQISDGELTALSSLGFDAIWLMGVWRISKAGRLISRIVSDDFQGSPYSVPDYRFNRNLGGRKAFDRLVNRAHAAGLRVLVDFVPNHTAVDSPWIDEHPEYYIRGNASVRPQETSEFFLHPSGEMIAFGRDPHFPPWNDTAQLDYTSNELRNHMTGVLKRIAQHADGVRADMAMLVMRDHIRRQWYPGLAAEDFDAAMPREFWEDAIAAVKKTRPDFLFIAEAYWGRETDLLNMGFDLAYDKETYDSLAARDAGRVIDRISRPIESLNRSLYFIENHDEPRAASIFSPELNVAAAALILSLPGSTLIHEGQMEGKKERLPVQRVRPLENEEPDPGLVDSYERVLRATAGDVFRSGSFERFDTGVYGVVSFLRRLQNRTVVYAGQISDAWHTFSATGLDLTSAAHAAGASPAARFINLVNGHSIISEASGGRFVVRPEELGADRGARFVLIEAAAG